MSKSKKKKVQKPQLGEEIELGENQYDKFDQTQHTFNIWQDCAANVWKILVKHPYIDRSNTKKVIADFFVSSRVDDLNLTIIATWISVDVDERWFMDDEDFFVKLISIFKKVVGKYIFIHISNF